MTALFLVAAGFLIWILGADGKRDSAACGELRGHDSFTRCAGSYKVVQNAVGDRFVERALVPIRREIKFQGFALDAETIGHVIDIDACKIRLPRYRANGSKIVCFKMNPVIAAGRRIWERLKSGLGRRGRQFRLAVPEQC